MENQTNIIDDLLAPFSRWANETFLGEEQGRTISQRFEDETGISKDVLHAGLILATMGFAMKRSGGKG